MVIVFFGSGEFALPTLNWLKNSAHQVALVVTQPPRPAGRGKRLTPTPVGVLAREFGWPVHEPENINDPAMVTTLGGSGARLGLVIAYGQKLGNGVLNSFAGGCINLHASLLPRYRGAAPINWAILKGEERTGCTVFRITERMDAGPVLSSRWTMIKPDETAGELHDRLAGIGVDAVDAALQLFANDRVPEGTPQDDALATRAPKLEKCDGTIRFDSPAEKVVRHIRGMTPWPGASTIFHGSDGRWEKIAIVRCRRAEIPTRPDLPPGTLDARLFVAAADGFVELFEVKPSAGRQMTWQDYVNGRHVRAGDHFRPPDE